MSSTCHEMIDRHVSYLDRVPMKGKKISMGVGYGREEK